ncbi:hypothetical protein [Paraburkholderia pallida]|uniref:Uncharacterized protein n=1 Tax=Paraburkholderia pallida TaxID=2547399 RepID=A0A4P7CTQ5_9BURK|nr:hypothetical protein [Paraburkholderia pallida]QBQ98156.1 hypothetical protein E1956_13885 [Paraburkholderia pallida]
MNAEKLIEKTELESGEGATLKIERIVLSKYASALLRAKPAAKGTSRSDSKNKEDVDAPSAGTGKPLASGA